MAFLGKASGMGFFAALTLVLGVAQGGCNWTRFDDQARGVPVRSIGAPSGFDSADFGKSIIPLSSGQGSAAAFIATGLNETHMALVKIDRAGGVQSFGVPGSALSDLGGSAITSVVEVPGSAPTRLLLGTPVVKNETFGRIYAYALPDVAVIAANPGMPAVGTDPAITFPVPSLTSVDSGLGRGLAAGFLAGDAATPDYLVGSDNEVAVVVDGVATAMTPFGQSAVGACEVGYDNLQENRYLLHRPLVAARLWADPAGPAVQQIVVGSTHGATPGQVSFLNMTAAGAMNCLATVTGTKPQFGHALATGDFDGDGSLDLAVGAPGQQASVYLGWAGLPIGTVPAAPVVIAMAAGVDFGYAVASLDLDGLPGDELLISDPRATVGGKTQAGHVLVFKFNPQTRMMDQLQELADLSPETDANFGYTLNALAFCRADLSATPGAPCPASDSSRILLVGAGNEVFVYFRVGENIPLQPGQSAPDVRSP